MSTPPLPPGGWPPQASGYSPLAGAVDAPMLNVQGLTEAMVTCFVGAGFIILASVVWFTAALELGTTSVPWLGFAGVNEIFLGGMGLAVGGLVIVCALFARTHPRHHEVLGLAIIGLAFASIFSYFGGLFLGFLLTLIGGVLTVLWRPPAPMFYYPSTPPVLRVCPKCGRVIDLNAKFCSLCGNSVTPQSPAP